MENLLFIANLSPSVTDLFNDLSKTYAVKLVPFDYDQISLAVKTFSPQKAILYMDNLLDSESESLHKFLKDSVTSTIPLICIGNNEIIQHYVVGWGGNIIKIILTPASVSSILKYIKQSFESLAEKNKKHILVIDDSIVYLHTVTNILKDSYKVSSAKSGETALTFLINHKPDLILLDYSMPELSGPEVFQKIRLNTHTKDIPIVFLTGVSSKEQVQTVMSLKPNGYILKNCDANELLSRIEDFFD